MEDLETPYRNLLAALKEQAEEDKLFLNRVTIAMDNLNLYNSLYADMVVDLAENLTDFALAEGEDPGAEMEIDEQYGKGINLYRIVGALSDYDESNDTKSLDEAMAYIFREKERRLLC